MNNLDLLVTCQSNPSMFSFKGNGGGSSTLGFDELNPTEQVTVPITAIQSCKLNRWVCMTYVRAPAPT